MSLSKIVIKAPKRSTVTKPEDIFRSLTLRGSVENLWAPQAEALSKWDSLRAEKDVVIEMTTGGGKTLVGLLLAQSLVNETNGKVVYACPTNQLVEQTAAQSSSSGLPVATYKQGQWTGEENYDRCISPCITTYAALFNGLSIFRDAELKAIVFDDAHVANNAIRSQFSLNIPASDPLFKKVANLFQGFFLKSSRSQQFADALNGNTFELLFVPMFEVVRQADTLRKLMADNGIDASVNTKFSWAHLKDKLARCSVLISGARIEITPFLLPVGALPYFTDTTRRIYLTATLPSQVEFVRTFGVVPKQRVVPGGKSGEAQRQFLFVNGETEEEQRSQALALVETRKACIVSRSDAAASDWCPPAVKFDKGKGHGSILDFQATKETRKMVLAARYDGIDLPGDSCRVLILDGLPFGESLLDRFITQGVRIEGLRSTHIATRIVQAIGRIFRSNSDHGVVIVCGKELQRWMRDPNNQQYMPKLLQQQVQLGIELSRNVADGKTTYEELICAVLGGSRDWDELYTSNVGSFEANDCPKEAGWLTEIAVRERMAFAMVWDGQFASAAVEYASLAADADARDRRLGAWLRHMEGWVRDLQRDPVAATNAYLLAANERAELGRPSIKAGAIDESVDVVVSHQARRITEQIGKHRAKLLQKIDGIVGALIYGPETSALEQALRDLGELVGFQASRPDKDTGAGPDVLWRYPELKGGIALEAKTNKKPQSQYDKKEDIGQFLNHVGWLETNHAGENFKRAIVGRRLQVSRQASPPPDLRIIPLEQFVELASRLRELIVYVQNTATEKDLDVCTERGLRSFGLLWPQCIESMESSLAIDLQDVESSSQATT